MAAVSLQPAMQPIGEHHSAACSGFVAQQPATATHVVYDDVPAVVHASEQRYIKSEDVIFVRSSAPVLGDVHSVFMVCDGHMGVGAATHTVKHMPGLLSQLLPQHLPDWTIDSEVELYAEKVRRAISTAAVLLDNDWAQLNDSSGTTLTMAVLSGWLLTIANTGDSNAILDSGDDVQEITCSHRIQVNKAEQDRLRQAGAQLAPVGFHLQGPAKPQEMGVGPLRMWPGGLCVSRSIGDLDAGPLIVPMPHVRQVVLNRSRALRLIMASDGLWDLMSFTKAAKSVRHKLPDAAVNALMQMAVRDRRMADDVSVIIADLLPPLTPGATPPQFPAAALKAGSISRSTSLGGRSSSGGLFRCFKASAVNDADAADIQPPQPSQPPRRSLDLRQPFARGLARLSGRANVVRRPGPPPKPWLGLKWFADVDCYEAYPMHKTQLARKEAAVVQRPKTPPKRIGDYTVHGGQAHKFQQDSSWHTGNSHHGDNSVHPLLSQQQLQELEAVGPAAAASMHFSSTIHDSSNSHAATAHSPRQQQQQQQQGPYSSALYSSASTGGAMSGAAAAAGPLRAGDSAPVAVSRAAASDSGGSAQQQQQQQQPAAHPGGGGSSVPLIMRTSRSILVGDDIPPPPSAAAAAAGRGSKAGQAAAEMPGRSQRSVTAAAVPPAAAAAGSLTRSASAEFEHEGTAGVYVAPDGGRQGLDAPGRVVKPSPAATSAHFGSAPEAVGADGGRVHRGGGALAAAAAASEDDK